ncbi:N-terminal half of MaoC dehydratase [Thermomonospora echinospora]|uniref:N-terminal half of MaoC dehydratase n=1 Tax=Thermomonospora echinospora TaxID=1992 RepID=A0A1H6E9R3_9ACTN|nr:MaoC/PaaZ C-terminal domain-containing protein [Thermomonospora echinospora]SEG93666.1 N-terminal half of MaoC dehydratase [Thermomonospora echinospora]
MEPKNAGDWIGRFLGERTVTWTERDAILYALAVGARATELDLVYEERLRPLPTFGLTLAQWGPDALGGAGAFDTARGLHGAQHLEVLAPLPPRGELTMSACVEAVWDKGSAAVFEVRVDSECFVARWSIFAPGAGGFGGERGPSGRRAAEWTASRTTTVETFTEQAALYRLCGDQHAIHIDPAAARAIGQERPILHGLCTMATSLLVLARTIGAHPADLREAGCRFTAPVVPGDVLELKAHVSGGTAAFEVCKDATPVIGSGLARFGDG